MAVVKLSYPVQHFVTGSSEGICNYMSLLLLCIWNENGVLPGGSGIAIRHNTKIHISHKITHHAQSEHSTQSYTNNKRHITHNEYNKNK
jgi:hypothetical protein